MMEHTVRGRLLALLASAALMSAVALGGCAQEDQQQPEPESSSAAEPASSSSVESSSSSQEEQVAVIGTKTDAAAAVTLKNGLGGNVTFVSIVPTGSQDEPTSLPIDLGLWRNGQTATLYYVPDEDVTAYDLVFSSNGTFYDLKAVDLSAIPEATVNADNGIAYLVYTQDGTTVSTLETQRMIAENGNDTAAADTDYDVVYYDYDYYDYDDADADDDADGDADGDDYDEDADADYAGYDDDGDYGDYGDYDDADYGEE